MKAFCSLSHLKFVALTLIICCAVNVAAQTGSSGNKPVAQKASAQPETRAGNSYPFEFHSGFWTNLHHFLYLQALERGQGGQTESRNNPAGQLTAEQQRLWDAAVDYYKQKLIKRDLLFDRELVAIDHRLEQSEAARDLRDSGVNSELVKVLESVAPVYRAQWWPLHDRANRFWIAVVTPMVQQLQAPVIEQLTKAYKAKWPAQLIRVDVAVYANWAGAYTTFDEADRVHTIVASPEADNQAYAALEIVFHEASHSMVSPNEGAVAEAIARVCRAKNKPIPRDLWHAILFYTTGEIVRRNLSQYGVSGYVPYAYHGLWTRAWPNFQKPLELYWQPYLDGKTDFETAMSRLIDAL